MKFGRIDVDEFIDSIPAELLRKWRVFAEADGWDSQWSHTAEVLSWINSSSSAIQNAILAAGGVKPPKTEFLSGDDIRRAWRGKGKRHKPKGKTGEQLRKERERGQYGY